MNISSDFYGPTIANISIYDKITDLNLPNRYSNKKCDPTKKSGSFKRSGISDDRLFNEVLTN